MTLHVIENKIYEIRDISDEDSYYVKAFLSDRQSAIDAVKNPRGWEIADNQDEVVRLAVIEHTLNKWDHEKGFDVRILEVTFLRHWDEKDDDKWVMSIDFDKEIKA